MRAPPPRSTLFPYTTLFRSVTFLSAGSRAVIATDTSNSTITGRQSAIQVSPASTAYFVVDTPSSAVSGVPIDVTVSAKDAYDNATPGYLGTVHFATFTAVAF